MTDRIRVGIIGCGNISYGGHAPTLRDMETVQIVGIADPTDDRRQKMQALLNLPDEACFASHTELLALKPDYVIVTTPQQFRRPIVEACAQAGVHVLSEKPIATRPADAQAMVDAMRTAGLRYGIVHNYLYYPEYILARNLINEGAIGKLRHITLNFLGVPDHPGAAEYRPRWRHDPREAGGGILMDMIHAVYLIEFLANEPIQAVSAIADNLDHPGEQVEDFTIANYFFEAGYATINMWWGNGPGGLEISGTEGRIMVFYENYGTGPFTRLDSFTLVNGNGLQNFDPRAGAAAPSFRTLHTDFGEAIRAGRDPIAPAEAGLRALHATLGAYTSATTGRALNLPFEAGHPVFEQGVGGIADLEIWRSGPLARRPIFGLTLES